MLYEKWHFVKIKYVESYELFTSATDKTKLDKYWAI